MMAYLLVNRRKEIQLFLSLFSPEARRRALVFYHARGEHRLGSSHLLEFLAFAETDHLNYFTFSELGYPFDTALYRILFQCGEAAPQNVYYYKDILDRTVKTIGENCFPTYKQTVAFHQRRMDKEMPRLPGSEGRVLFWNPHFSNTEIGVMAGTVIQLPAGTYVPLETSYFNHPTIRDDVTQAFLTDLRQLTYPIVWLIDGPWDRLESSTLNWIRSILGRVSRGEIQNLWIIVGGCEPIEDVSILRSYSGVLCCELQEFTPDAIKEYLQIYFALPTDSLDILATAIWRLSGGHPGKVSFVIDELRGSFPNLRKPDVDVCNYGLVLQR